MMISDLKRLLRLRILTQWQSIGQKLSVMVEIFTSWRDFDLLDAYHQMEFDDEKKSTESSAQPSATLTSHTLAIKLNLMMKQMQFAQSTPKSVN